MHWGLFVLKYKLLHTDVHTSSVWLQINVTKNLWHSLSHGRHDESWHNWVTNSTCVTHMSHGTHSSCHTHESVHTSSVYLKLDISHDLMCSVSHSYMWHDFMCAMTRIQIRHDLMCAMTHIFKFDTTPCVPWLLYSNSTQPHVCHDSYIQIWHDPMCAMTRIQIRHDSSAGPTYQQQGPDVVMGSASVSTRVSHGTHVKWVTTHINTSRRTYQR